MSVFSGSTMGEPTFVIGGAQRSGTTTLYHLLDAHPQVFLAKPLRPEPKFFVAEPRLPRDRGWYLETYFAAAEGYRAAGEKSATYIEAPGAAERMKRLFPRLKCVFILRHPVERAVSNWRFSRRNGFEPLALAEALAQEPQRLAHQRFAGLSAHPQAYLRRGHYVDYLEPFRARFAADELCILLHDDLKGGAPDFWPRLCAFLGVDAIDAPWPDRRYNAAGPDEPLELLRLDDERLAAVHRHFYESNRRLEELLGRDLAHWDRPTEQILDLVSGRSPPVPPSA